MATPRKPKDQHLKRGRPSTYTVALGQKICRAVASSSDTLKKICQRNPDFPNRECIWGWRLDYPEFANLYNDARRIQADLMAEEIIDIADDDSQDVMINDAGNAVQNTEFIARSRVRMDARKWIACKMLPKVYGDRATEETNEKIDALREQIESIKGIAQKCMKPL